MENKKNLLIEASAGTGKTQALAERLIALLKRGVPPPAIVALTFSRAAAGEIFERFVTLLADQAEKEATSPVPPSTSDLQPSAAGLLREVLATQHLSQIGTLDSFLLRIVRAFPLELGLMGELELRDDYRARSDRSRIAFSILHRTDEALKRRFTDAFLLAMNQENVRSFVDSYRAFVADWHERFIAEPDECAWGDAAAIWGRVPAFATVGARELAAAADALVGLEDSAPWRDFTEWVRNFRGSWELKGIAKKLFELEAPFSGDALEFDFGSGKNKHRAFFGSEAASIRTALGCVCGYVVRRQLELARGIRTLIAEFEKEYDAKVRRRGRLVFADVPRLITALDEASRLNLEYRLDSRLGAWALDEFQDTSREQWKALSNLIEEAKQSPEKSVFVVGDCKQAIYGWRNGDVTIFGGEKSGGEYAQGELKKSYRFGPAVTEAVNRVFASGMIERDFPAWECPVHETAKPDLDGFVQTVEAAAGDKDAFVEPLYHALQAVDPVGRGIAAAVLVRTNPFGEFLAARLRALGLKNVVWEGESAILDTPALSGFLDLVQLADHPGDMLAYRHFRMTPLAAAKYPDGVPSAAAISAEFATALTTRGLVRTFRELRALLPDEPEAAWSRFTEERFTDMLRAAAEFELSREPGTRLADFADFLKAKKKRNLAKAGEIRIMTIHRSKGLSFDYVALPLYEHDALNSEVDGPLVGDGWILPDPGPRAAKFLGGLEEAYRLRKDRAEQEALCAYYVAMTRARQAMTIVLHPAAKSGSSIRISDYVRRAIPEPIGRADWYCDFRPRAADAAAATALTPPRVRAPRETVRRRLPSLGFASGQSAGELFVRENARKAAMARGTAVHAEYEKIEFDERLPKPEGFVELWREKSFELFADGEWISGCIDRVTFFRREDGLHADVVDFKTNRPLRGETAEAFAARLRAAYSGQLAAYRRAVTALTSVPSERIVTRLLLVNDGTEVVI